MGPTIQIGEQTVITVDAKAAGKGKVTCTVCTPDGGEVDVDVVENADGTFDIFYTAPQPGKYVICVRFGGEQIPNSPFQVTVSHISYYSSVAVSRKTSRSKGPYEMPCLRQTGHVLSIPHFSNSLLKDRCPVGFFWIGA